MGQQKVKVAVVRGHDVTKPHLRKELHTTKIADEPALSRRGFWPKSVHGITPPWEKKDANT